MAEFFQQVVAGLATGSIFSALALALVLIHRATGVINFAQGEMAMFTTYIAWTLTANHGWSYWPAFAATLVLAFLLGFGLQRVVIRPIERASILTTVIVTIGLVLIFNGLAGLIWSAEVRAFPSPFPNDTWEIGGVAISQQDVGTLAVVLVMVTLLWAFFQFTKTGLALRASALNPDASRLVGVRVGWMLAIGWGLAAVLGAVAGMMTAPTVFLDPNMMQAVLIYAFAAAVLGGIDSPFGAVAGGLMLGVGLNLIGTYIDFVGAGLRLPVALLIILVVLLVKPRRPLRQARHEARVKRTTSPGSRSSCSLRLRSSTCRSCLGERLPRAAVRVRRDLLHRPPRAERAHRLHRARSRSATAPSWRSAATRPRSSSPTRA